MTGDEILKFLGKFLGIGFLIFVCGLIVSMLRGVYRVGDTEWLEFFFYGFIVWFFAYVMGRISDIIIRGR